MAFIKSREKDSMNQYHQHYINTITDIVQCAIAQFTLEEKPKLIYGNREFFDLIGYTSEEFENLADNKITNIIYEYDYDRTIQFCSDMMLFDTRKKFDIRIVRKDNDVRWVTCSMKRTINCEANPIILVSMVDITESVLKQKRIDEISENVPCGLARINFIKDKIKLVHANSDFYSLFMNDDDFSNKMLGNQEFFDDLYSRVLIDPDNCPKQVRFNYESVSENSEKKFFDVECEFISNDKINGINIITYIVLFKDVTLLNQVINSQSALMNELSGGKLEVTFNEKAACEKIDENVKKLFDLDIRDFLDGFYSLFFEKEREKIKNIISGDISEKKSFSFKSFIGDSEMTLKRVSVCGVYLGNVNGFPKYKCYLFDGKNTLLNNEKTDVKVDSEVDSYTGLQLKRSFCNEVDKEIQKLSMVEEWYLCSIRFSNLASYYNYNLSDVCNSIIKDAVQIVKEYFQGKTIFGRTSDFEVSLLVSQYDKEKLKNTIEALIEAFKEIIIGEDERKLNCKIGICSVDEEDYCEDLLERNLDILDTLECDNRVKYDFSYIFEDDINLDIEKRNNSVKHLKIAEDKKYNYTDNSEDILGKVNKCFEESQDFNDGLSQVISFINEKYDIKSLAMVELKISDNTYMIRYFLENNGFLKAESKKGRFETSEYEKLKKEIINKEVIILNDVEDMPIVRELCSTKDDISYLIFPIVESNNLMGYLRCEVPRNDLYAQQHDLNKINLIVKYVYNYINKINANENEKFQKEFMSRMSHEIRTPMNAISGMADMLLANKLTGMNLEYVNHIKSAINNLITIVDDILDMSMIDSGEIEIVNDNYEIQSLVEDMVAFVNSNLYKKDISFVVYANPDIPSVLFGDEKRIRQIVFNLLSNALKFTEKGFIKLTVDYEFVDNQQIELTITVKDSGIGISVDDQEKLFKQFSQVDNRVNRNVDGVGLGLTISKKMAELMQGTISVESEEGIGSLFTLSVNQKVVNRNKVFSFDNIEQIKILVYEKNRFYKQEMKFLFDKLSIVSSFVDNKKDFIAKSNEGSYTHCFFDYGKLFFDLKQIIKNNPDTEFVAMVGNETIYPHMLDCDNYKFFNKPLTVYQLDSLLNDTNKGEHENYQNFVAEDLRVLIVDDNTVNIKVAQGLISSYNCKITTAQSGYEALDIISENPDFDILFIDHMMPKMDGVETLLTIRQEFGEYGKNVPAVALTANVLPDAQRLFRDSGFQEFLAKPIVSKQLHAIMDKLVKDDYKQMFNNSDKKRITDLLTENDIERVAMRGVDVESGLRCCGNNVEEYLDLLTVVFESGKKKVEELKRYAEEKNYEMYGIEAHAFKSVAASIGAIKQSDMAREHEFAVKEKNYSIIDMEYQKLVNGYQRLLGQIQNVLEKEENKHSSEVNKIVVESFVWKRKIRETVQAISNYEQRHAKELLKELSEYKLPDEVCASVKKAEEMMKIYEDEAALKVLEDVITIKEK